MGVLDKEEASSYQTHHHHHHVISGPDFWSEWDSIQMCKRQHSCISQAEQSEPLSVTMVSGPSAPAVSGRGGVCVCACVCIIKLKTIIATNLCVNVLWLNSQLPWWVWLCALCSLEVEGGLRQDFLPHSQIAVFTVWEHLLHKNKLHREGPEYDPSLFDPLPSLSPIPSHTSLWISF